jgi:hypothetical protein
VKVAVKMRVAQEGKTMEWNNEKDNNDVPGLCAWPIMRPKSLFVGRPRPPIQRRFSMSSRHPRPGLGLEWIGSMVWGPCGSVSAAQVQAALHGECLNGHWAICRLAGRRMAEQRDGVGVDCVAG